MFRRERFDVTLDQILPYKFRKFFADRFIEKFDVQREPKVLGPSLKEGKLETFIQTTSPHFIRVSTLTDQSLIKPKSLTRLETN